MGVVVVHRLGLVATGAEGLGQDDHFREALLELVLVPLRKGVERVLPVHLLDDRVLGLLEVGGRDLELALGHLVMDELVVEVLVEDERREVGVESAGAGAQDLAAARVDGVEVAGIPANGLELVVDVALGNAVSVDDEGVRLEAAARNSHDGDEREETDEKASLRAGGNCLREIHVPIGETKVWSDASSFLPVSRCH